MTERDGHEESHGFEGVPDLMACPPALRPVTPEAFEEWGARMRARARERHLAHVEPQRSLDFGTSPLEALIPMQRAENARMIADLNDEHAKLRDAGFFG